MAVYLIPLLSTRPDQRPNTYIYGLVRVTPVSNQRHRFGLAIIGRAIRASGVHGVTLKGDEIEVTGERVDSVILALLLKKSFRHAELVSVGPVEEKKKENKEEPTMQPLVWPCTSFPQYPICEMRTIGLDLIRVDSVQGADGYLHKKVHYDCGESTTIMVRSGLKTLGHCGLIVAFKVDYNTYELTTRYLHEKTHYDHGESTTAVVESDVETLGHYGLNVTLMVDHNTCEFTTTFNVDTVLMDCYHFTVVVLITIVVINVPRS
ncbi:hypothetical protein JHK82_034883 [Glycine max]|nr:hypothetical protein JHK85_035591 [Glycine max]KAG5111614.1 hypothetical protein JHK82_034883 [Glycine max]